MSTIGQRIRNLREERGMTLDYVASKIGISKQTLSRYERGIITNIPSDKIEAIAEVFNVQPARIMGWEDDILIRPSAHGAWIPVLGRVAAGLPLEAVQDVLDYEEIPTKTDAKDYFALKLKGDSMSPRLSDGDVVIVRKQDTVDNGDIAIVLVNGEDATCKKIQIFPEGISLVPLNPVYEPMFYTNEQVKALPVKIIGKVIEARMKL